MSGLYIHIPYCMKACSYCNFHFSTSTNTVDDMVNSILMELELRKNQCFEKIETIYFGGGTPSLIKPEYFDKIINSVKNIWSVGENPEITVEANPDDINSIYLEKLKKIGVNRLSIGVQSFNDSELKLMNRAHDKKQAIKSIKNSKRFFDNISIDLLYGTPYSNLNDWKSNVLRALDLDVNHISSYALTIEPKTVLKKYVKDGIVELPDDEIIESQFFYLVDKLCNEGYKHYELNSFCKNGFESRNNTAYWKGEKYIGLGPSAHGYNGKTRYWNVSNNSKFIKTIKEGYLPQTIEKLSFVDKYNETIMIGLRTSWGISLSDFRKKFGEKYLKNLKKNAKIFIEQGFLFYDSDCLKTSRKGMFIVDGISSKLFLIDFLEKEMYNENRILE